MPGCLPNKCERRGREEYSHEQLAFGSRFAVEGTANRDLIECMNMLAMNAEDMRSKAEVDMHVC